MCNYSEPCKIVFCECLHSSRIAILYGEVTTCVKLELRSNGFTNVVLNSKFNNDGEVEHEKSDSEKYGTGL